MADSFALSLLGEYTENKSVPLKMSAFMRPSDGQLNRSFKFGGLPRSQSSTSLAKNDKQQPFKLTLSDIIPPRSHVRSLSNSTSMDEDDSVLNSIFAKITGVQGRPRSNSDASARQIAQEKRRSIYKAMSRPASGISFTGFDSFDEVRRGFEFSDDRPTFYPPSAATRRVPHRRHESTLSTMSVSSYGRVINAGSLDPFIYGLSSLRESSEDMSSISILMDIKEPLHSSSWRIDPDDVWKATLPAFISLAEHQYPSNKDNPSLVDTAIEIPPCQFHHKVHPLVFITAASSPIVGTTRAPVLAPLRCRTQGMVQTVSWQLGHVIAKKFLLILL
jgi:hypothetical protein